MKKTKDEIIAQLKAFIGDNTSDEAINLLDDVSDSFEENKDETDWKAEAERIDKEWREKYISRFNNEDVKDDEEIEDEKNSNDKPLTFENLFEEG